ncbi:MAG: phosphoglucomutase/phosphomannomutase family protein [Candidatus Sericytochromatia bacterium]|nr:phosphoglucomutase/phosphomannomutase family protein [Candidatus Tanganyikabacteria bacterium]
MSRIAFGTDGWRAERGAGFDASNLARVAVAVARVWRDEAPADDRPVLVGGDTRTGSAEGVRLVAGVLAGAGFTVMRVEGPVTTPNMSHAVVHGGARGALVVTASHNSASWNGLKIKQDFGGSAEPSFTARVEEAVAEAPTVRPVDPDGVPVLDPRPAYLEALAGLVDLERIRQALVRPEEPLRVAFDAMHGASAGYLERLLGPSSLVSLRAAPDPAFGGVHPEPIAQHLGPLRAVLEAWVEPGIGLACDGDGDRIGAVAEGGAFVNAHLIMALLTRHLLEVRRWSGDIVKTLSTSVIIDRLARQYGRSLHVVPIGFKYVAAEMRARHVMLGGEESGGIGFSCHLPERDGILSALLLLEACAYAGTGMRGLIASLREVAGAHAYDRVDLPLMDPPLVRAAIEGLHRQPPATLIGRPVASWGAEDGLKATLEDGSWLLLRLSGTEPLLRLYAEAASDADVALLLAEGRRLSGAASGEA